MEILKIIVDTLLSINESEFADGIIPPGHPEIRSHLNETAQLLYDIKEYVQKTSIKSAELETEIAYLRGHIRQLCYSFTPNQISQISEDYEIPEEDLYVLQ